MPVDQIKTYFLAKHPVYENREGARETGALELAERDVRASYNYIVPRLIESSTIASVFISKDQTDSVGCAKLALEFYLNAQDQCIVMTGDDRFSRNV